MLKALHYCHFYYGYLIRMYSVFQICGEYTTKAAAVNAGTSILFLMNRQYNV